MSVIFTIILTSDLSKCHNKMKLNKTFGKVI
jgi:hypothetical protein